MEANTVSNVNDPGIFFSRTNVELPSKGHAGDPDHDELSQAENVNPQEVTPFEHSADGASHLTSPQATNGASAGAKGSTMEPSTAIPVKDEKASSELLARFDRLTRHRDKVLTLRMELDHELSRLDDCRRFFSDAVEALMEYQKKSGADPSLPTTEAMMRVKNDYDVLTQQNQLVSKLGHNLSEREYKLARLEGHFCRKARQVLASLFPDKSFNIPRALPGARRIDPSEESSDVPSTVDVHPLLQAYFDALGEAGVYSERLVELDFEYREKRTQRDLRVDQELPVDPPDHEFEQQHLDEQTEINNDLSRAILKAENLRQSCIQKGLDPDETLRTSSGGQSSYVTSTVSSEVSAVPSRDLNQVFQALAGRTLNESHHPLRFASLIHDAPGETDQAAQTEDRMSPEMQKLNIAKIEGWREAVERDIPEISSSDQPELAPFEEVRPFADPLTTFDLETARAPPSPVRDEDYGSHSHHGSVVAPHDHVVPPVGPLSPPSTVIHQQVSKLGNNQIDRVPAILPTRQLVRTFSDPELQRWLEEGSTWNERVYRFRPRGERIAQQRPMPSERQS